MDVDWINRQLSVAYNQCYAVTKEVLENVGKRYLFSSYVIDPNKYRFRKVVRIVALIILFIVNLKLRIKKAIAVMSCNEAHNTNIITYNSNAMVILIT